MPKSPLFSSGMKIVVLDGFAAAQGRLSYDALALHGEVVVYPRTAPAELLTRAANADVLLTNKVLLDAGTLARLPALKYVGIVATGTNAVDLAACAERGIAVTNVPGYSTDSVAELVFALLFHFTRGVAAHDARVKDGAWSASPDFMFCVRPLHELAGKTIAIVGTGAIGRAVTKIAEALRMRVIAARVPGSPSPERTPLDVALPLADFVTLHCPLTKMTEKLVNDAFLGKMKREGILVNTGRGGLVDEAALARALTDGTIGGAALDVLEREPPLAGNLLLDPDAPFAARLVVTPHIGWATEEARSRLIAAVADNLSAFLRGEDQNRVERATPQKVSTPPVI